MPAFEQVEDKTTEILQTRTLFNTPEKGETNDTPVLNFRKNQLPKILELNCRAAYRNKKFEEW